MPNASLSDAVVRWSSGGDEAANARVSRTSRSSPVTFPTMKDPADAIV
jgi:hypothetical protein